MFWFSATLLSTCIVLVLVAALYDLATRTVPNWMAMALAALGIVQRSVDGTIGASLIAAVAIFCGAALCWRRGWLGGADVKLLAAAAVVVPPSQVFDLLTLVALAGGVLALFYVVVRRLGPAPKRHRPRSLPARIARVERWRLCRRPTLPYVCAIAAGLVLTLIGARP
jgi:prepilin peptidase CpaA